MLFKVLTFFLSVIGVMAVSNDGTYSIPRLQDYYISEKTGFMLEEPLVCVRFIDVTNIVIHCSISSTGRSNVNHSLSSIK